MSCIGPDLGEGGKTFLVVALSFWIHSFVSNLILLFREWLRVYQVVQRKGFTWSAIQTLGNTFISTWTNLVLLVATIYSSNSSFVSSSFCFFRWDWALWFTCLSLCHIEVSEVFYICFLCFDNQTFLCQDQLTWYSFEITPSVTSLERDGLSPVSPPPAHCSEHGLTDCNHKKCAVICCSEINSFIWEILLSWLLEVRRCFQKWVMFSLHSIDYIVVWASVCPALQTHIIIPVVVHCITSYRVAVIFIIEMAAMMLLPEALK